MMTFILHVSYFTGTTNQTKDGSIVRKCRVADKSASICFSLWNEQAGAIEAGDILKLTKGSIIRLVPLLVLCVVYMYVGSYNWIKHACHM